MMTIHQFIVLVIYWNYIRNYKFFIACQYTCDECSGPDSDMCLKCPETRGDLPNNTPIYNECPCALNLIDYHQKICLGKLKFFIFIPFE